MGEKNETFGHTLSPEETAKCSFYLTLAIPFLLCHLAAKSGYDKIRRNVMRVGDVNQRDVVTTVK